ncbi:unnamed protein product [Moneuplotes crassus]|uniref:Uncharacterized protein n=1 Tax=Euplotes crassus TaxID=5936 RepID=A0AAD2CXN6_EUPCR|nr:unnamed protein product [Moneuplotes crassus]
MLMKSLPCKMRLRIGKMPSKNSQVYLEDQHPALPLLLQLNSRDLVVSRNLSIKGDPGCAFLVSCERQKRDHPTILLIYQATGKIPVVFISRFIKLLGLPWEFPLSKVKKKACITFSNHAKKYFFALKI